MGRDGRGGEESEGEGERRGREEEGGGGRACDGSERRGGRGGGEHDSNIKSMLDGEMIHIRKSIKTECSIGMYKNKCSGEKCEEVLVS